jgi:hypothetical protein
MGWLLRYKRSVAGLAAFALLANVLAAALCLTPATSKVAPIADDVLGVLVICTSNGAHTPQDDGPGRQQPSEHCTMCTLLASFALVLSVLLFALHLEPQRALRLVASGISTLAEHLGLGGIRSRAPPLPA